MAKNTIPFIRDAGFLPLIFGTLKLKCLKHWVKMSEATIKQQQQEKPLGKSSLRLD